MPEPPARHPGEVPASSATSPAPATPPMPPMPVDSDVDLGVARQRAELREAPWTTLGAIAAGGAAGALARYELVETFPHPPGGFPWTTFAINVTGCLLIGVLMVLITETWQAHRLVRPFLGVGVLGGFTTFSAYVADIGRLTAEGAPRTALAYLFGTVAAAVAATWLGVATTRSVTRPRFIGRREGP